MSRHQAVPCLDPVLTTLTLGDPRQPICAWARSAAPVCQVCCQPAGQPQTACFPGQHAAATARLHSRTAKGSAVTLTSASPSTAALSGDDETLAEPLHASAVWCCSTN